jgi:four helix bundle protein
MKSYKDLDVWEFAMANVTEVFKQTKLFPVEERFGLSQQMRRAAVSVPSNIAEAYGRRSRGQRYQFLEHAMGSLFELETQVEVARRLNFAAEKDVTKLQKELTKTGRALQSLMKYVAQDSEAPKRPPKA